MINFKKTKYANVLILFARENQKIDKCCSILSLSEINYSVSKFVGNCSAGFHCKGGASNPSTADGVSIVECPEGHYCTQGTTSPTGCPIGTWSNSTGLATQGECQSCPGGYYCDSVGLTEPKAECSAGYYCSSRAIMDSPSDGVTGDPCTIGHYCPLGTAVPVPCGDGTFMAKTGASACDPCTPGYSCTNGVTLDDCPAGYYCPEGTGAVYESCPAGTYSNFTNLWHIDNCTQCSQGQYCASVAATAETGPCSAGYYCLSGSDSATPGPSSTGDAGVCPEGYYCQAGTGNPEPCPRGTFSNTTQLTSSGECTPCSGGMYCQTTGLTEPTGDCDPGYYCVSGAQQKNPQDGTTGGECPEAHYCPTGTSNPLICPAGTYNPHPQQAACVTCKAGFYCPENVTTFRPYVCPVGHYCPAGTEFDMQYPCPQGYYNHLEEQKDIGDCDPCPAGKYCNETGLSTWSGDCAAGWYCISGARTDQPLDIGNYTASNCTCPSDLTGGQCQIGEFCPTGSSSPTACTGGGFRFLYSAIFTL